MLTILLWLLFLSSVSSILLRDSFKYCSTNKDSLELDVSSVCQLTISKTSNQLQNMAILEKSDYSLDGWGYRCNKIKSVFQTMEYFFGYNKDFPPVISDIALSRTDCLAMVLSKKCNENEMHCVNDHCEYIGKPSLTYEWEAIQSFTVFS